jgi:uncharacterized protein (TIGR00251 family)
MVKASPGAEKNAINGFSNGVLKIKVAAQPEKGRANRELENFLSGIFGISKSSVEVISGLSSRSKKVMLRNISAENAEAILLKNIRD